MTSEETDRVVEMAWEDRTPFEAIEAQFGLSESDVIKLMREQLKRSSFIMWRKRVHSGVSQKHLLKRTPGINRFKSALQRIITHNNISKR
ncbi:TIGR03643 family protein [Dyadobacter sp. CY345]|uniref:TIGR03643 family protein n=1 Tax=Dyadobacter sp. CY345 TaxID=2909335 RepID=UPI001F2DE6D6|nr:TIGR03643 family protein [Dyadobacter sp. CY345]MCF2443688.1 TIGR03643 family protein [Dyadobacter sp. CY345]